MDLLLSFFYSVLHSHTFPVELSTATTITTTTTSSNLRANQIKYPRPVSRTKLSWLPLVKIVTLPMLRLLSFKAQGCKDLWKPSKSCHVGIHWIALAENSQMSTNMPGFQSFFRFFRHFVLAKLATSRVSFNWPIPYFENMHITSFIFSFVNKQAKWLEYFVSTAHYLTFFNGSRLVRKLPVNWDNCISEKSLIWD